MSKTWWPATTKISTSPYFCALPYNLPFLSPFYGWKLSHACLDEPSTTELCVSQVLFLVLLFLSLWVLARGWDPFTSLLAALVSPGLMLPVCLGLGHAWICQPLFSVAQNVLYCVLRHHTSNTAHLKLMLKI